MTVIVGRLVTEVTPGNRCAAAATAAKPAEPGASYRAASIAGFSAAIRATADAAISAASARSSESPLARTRLAISVNTPVVAIETTRIASNASMRNAPCARMAFVFVDCGRRGMYQTPFSDRIRNEVGIATMAVGAIFEADHVNSIVAAGRADLCAIARPHLANASWTLIEAAKIGHTNGIGADWPRQYIKAKSQLERGFERERSLAAQNAAISAAERRSLEEGV